MKQSVTIRFRKTEEILIEWLDNAQRHSGYKCEEQFEAAMAELRAADNTIHEYCCSLD